MLQNMQLQNNEQLVPSSIHSLELTLDKVSVKRTLQISDGLCMEGQFKDRRAKTKGKKVS